MTRPRAVVLFILLLSGVVAWYVYKPTPPLPKAPWLGTEGYYLVQRSEWRREWGRESDGFLLEVMHFYPVTGVHWKRGETVEDGRSGAEAKCSRNALRASLSDEVVQSQEIGGTKLTYACVYQAEGAKMPPPETGWDPAWGDPNNPIRPPPTKYPRGPKGK